MSPESGKGPSRHHRKHDAAWELPPWAWLLIVLVVTAFLFFRLR